MEPITWVLLAAAAWVVAAPDPVTASTRSGIGSAIGSAGRAAGRSIGSDMRSAAAKRSAAHKARLDRWAGRGDLMGRSLIRLDRVFGRGGAVDSAGRRVGEHGRVAWAAGREAWATGRLEGRRGLPAPIRRRLAPHAPKFTRFRDAVVVALALDEKPATPLAAQSSSASGGGKKEAPVAPNGSKQKWAEITGTPTLRGEAKELDGEIASAEQHLKVLNGWLDSIQERYATADIGTKPIGTAIQAAYAARKGIEDGLTSLTALAEGLAQLRKALDAADGIGEVAAQQDAKGDVKGYQAA